MVFKKNGAWRIVLVHGALIVLISLGLAGCSSGGQGPIAVEGRWLLEGEFGSERWTIAENSIEYESDFGSGFSTVFRADVVDYYNTTLNAGDSRLTSNAPAAAINPGFAVLRYTYVNNPGTGEVGAYNVFRWADNATDPSKRDFTQGSKDADLDGDGDPSTGEYVNDLFDDPVSAELGATNEAGYFGFASQGAERMIAQ